MMAGATIQPADRWQIGKWIIDPDNHEAVANGVHVHLAPKSMSVLVLLARHPNQCVQRQQLIEAAWDRQFVQDEALTRVIADLRKALQDDSTTEDYIVTVPKRGYRLVAKVRRLPADDVPPEASQTIAATRSHEEPEPLAVRDNPAQARTPPTTPQAPLSSGWRRMTDGWPLPMAIAVLALTWALLGGGNDAHDAAHLELKDRLIGAMPITSEPGLEIQPRWSSGSNALVFAKLDTHRSDRSRLILYAMSDRSQQVLVDEGRMDLCPTPSPDGKLIAWQRYGDDQCTLMLRSMRSKTAIHLAPCAVLDYAASCPEFSADSKAIYFSAAPVSGSSAIHRIDVASGESHAITHPNPEQWDSWPRLSRDGRWLAFNRRLTDGNGQLMRTLANGLATELAIQTGRHGNRGHAWLAGATGMLLATDAIEFPGLVLQPLGAEPAVLLGARGARNPDIAGNGAIVFESAQYTGNLWHGRLDERELSQLTRSLKHDARPVFAPSGEQIAYISNRNGREALWIHTLSSQTEESAPLPEDSRWLNPSFSADGRSLVVSYFRNGAYGVCIYGVVTHKLDCPPALRGFNRGAMLPSGDIVASADDRRPGPLWRYRSGSPADLQLFVDRDLVGWSLVDDLLALVVGDGMELMVVRTDAPDSAIATMRLPGPQTHWALHRKGVIWTDEVQRSLIVRDTSFSGVTQTPDFPHLPDGVTEIAVSRTADRMVIAKVEELRTDLMFVR